MNMKRFVFKPKGRAQTVTVEVAESKCIGGRYSVLLVNKGHKAFEFAVICEGIVNGLFIAIPSQYRGLTKWSLKELIRDQYHYNPKPTWEEVDSFADEVMASVEEME